MRYVCAIGGLLLALLTDVPNAFTDDWPQFRGPNASGISTTTRPLPIEFSSTKNIRWSAQIGDGVGGAVVAAKRLFVSGMTARETVTLFAFDASTGQRLWRRDWPAGHLADIHEINSPASSTPAADAERVYFYFSTLGLLAVDARTGEEVWRRKLPVPFFVFKWGPAASPVLFGDLVLFCQDDDLYPALYAFDKATGKLRWRDDRAEMAVNYTHPVVCTAAGRDDIVVAGTGMLIGYDPASGRRRWFAKTLLRNIKTTPVAVDGAVYVSVQSGGIANQWLVAVDQAATGNSDGKLSKAEVQAFMGETPVPESFFKKTFDRGDLNRDGLLEGAELDAAFLHPDNFAGARFSAENSTEELILAVRGGGEGDVTATHVLWKHATRHTDHIVSPLILDGRMLLVKDGGITTVFDTGDGHSLRGPKRIGKGGNYFASPVYGDGKIYIAGAGGVVVVLKNSPAYEQLAANDMGENIIATPAIAEGCLFVRTRGKVFCICNGE